MACIAISLFATLFAALGLNCRVTGILKIPLKNGLTVDYGIIYSHQIAQDLVLLINAPKQTIEQNQIALFGLFSPRWRVSREFSVSGLHISCICAFIGISHIAGDSLNIYAKAGFLFGL